MPYLDCPRCHATFHIGAIYEPREVCPRCGTPFFSPKPRRRLRGGLRRRALAETPDWEAITGSQYIHHAARPSDEAGGDATGLA
jgi:hypothetical protein